MRACVFDTETTDLIDNIGRPLARQPYVIEFFGVTADHGSMELTESLGMLIRPPFTITSETTRITGITPDMLKDKLAFREHAQQIKAFIESHDRVVAHNLRYDMDMIDIEFARLDMTIDWPEGVCTVEATEYLEGYRLSLGKLHANRFGADFDDHHRAEPDTRALGRIYLDLVEKDML